MDNDSSAISPVKASKPTGLIFLLYLTQSTLPSPGTFTFALGCDWNNMLLPLLSLLCFPHFILKLSGSCQYPSDPGDRAFIQSPRIRMKSDHGYSPIDKLGSHGRLPTNTKVEKRV